MKFEEEYGFETTDCLECLQILDILIYGRRVCFRLWSSRTGNVLHFPFWRNFSILSFYKKYSASLCKTACFTPSRIPKGFADSKQSLWPLSSLSREGNVLHASVNQLSKVFLLQKRIFRFPCAVPMGLHSPEPKAYRPCHSCSLWL